MSDGFSFWRLFVATEDAIRGGPLEIPGGGDNSQNIPAKEIFQNKNCANSSSSKKSSCKQSKVINQTENHGDSNLLFDR